MSNLYCLKDCAKIFPFFAAGFLEYESADAKTAGECDDIRTEKYGKEFKRWHDMQI